MARKAPGSMDSQGVECLASGLPEGGGEPVPPPVAIGCCPVLLPHVGSQGQRCSRVGPVGPSVVESQMNLRWLVSLPWEGMSSRRTLRKGPTAAAFPFPSLAAPFWKGSQHH